MAQNQWRKKVNFCKNTFSPGVGQNSNSPHFKMLWGDCFIEWRLYLCPMVNKLGSGLVQRIRKKEEWKK